MFRNRMQVLKPFALLLLVFTGALCEARVETESLTVDGVQRSYRLFVPDRSSADTAHALVFDLHGTGGTPEGQSRNSDLMRIAAAQNFILVNPAGVYVRAPSSGASWNVDLDPRGVDDVKFIRAVLASLQKRYPIDSRRIYATGFSGGARMSSRLACDMSETFAAVALVGGVRYPEKCSPTNYVGVLAIHSEDDGVNHFEHRADSPAYWPEGVMDATADWATQNKCTSTPRIEQLNAATKKLSYEACAPGADVVLITSKQGGHSWPGSPMLKPADAEKFKGLSATEELWRFFVEHPKRDQQSDAR